MLAAVCRTCVTRGGGGGVRPGDRADDVEVLEQGDPVRPSEVGLRPDQPVGSADGYPGLAGLQHHHHGVNVGDADARVLAETPGKQTHPIKRRLGLLSSASAVYILVSSAHRSIRTEGTCASVAFSVKNGF